MSDERRCDCCKRYWYVDDLVSGLCPNCLDFLATKNQMSIEQDQKIKELEHRLSNCIEPKFKPHNDLFVIVGYKDEPKTVEQYYIDEIVVRGNGTLVEYRDIEKRTAKQGVKI